MAEPSDPSRNKLLMACPSCGHEQWEPRLAVSTVCRGCGSHYQIENGKPVEKAAPPPMFRPAPAAVVPQSSTAEAEVAVDPPRNAPLRPLDLALEPKKALNRLFAPKEPERREVACVRCDRIHTALAAATATNCPSCGAYISLKNYDIRDAWSRTIETRGNVVIHRSGSITGVAVRCHDLEVNGEFNGTAECSGDLTIRSSLKILGRIRCHRLRIERRAQVEFFSPVLAVEALIDGEVTGDLVCSGRLTLEKKALLTGDITAGALTIKEGARHHGSVSSYDASAGSR